jgi:hypothetical protein
MVKAIIAGGLNGWADPGWKDVNITFPISKHEIVDEFEVVKMKHRSAD